MTSTIDNNIDNDQLSSSLHSPGSLDEFLLDLRRHLAVSQPSPSNLVGCAARYLFDLQRAITSEDSTSSLSKYNQNHQYITNPGLINSNTSASDEIEIVEDEYDYEDNTVIQVSSSADDNDCDRVARDTTDHSKGMII